jgi:acyl-CoA thioester hydrolase
MDRSEDSVEADRRDPRSYTFWTRDTVRFSDVDRYRHINNVAIATYCETGRVEFAEALWPGSTAGESVGWVIVRLCIAFLTQAHYPGAVEIGTRVERVGRTSCRIGQGLFKDDACFATGEAVLVWADLETGRAAPFPLDLDRRLRTEAARAVANGGEGDVTNPATR